MRTVGNVSGKVYTGYLRAGGNWCVIFIVTMLCVLTQLAASGGDFFISRWVDIEENYVSVIINAKIISELHWGINRKDLRNLKSSSQEYF